MGPGPVVSGRDRQVVHAMLEDRDGAPMTTVEKAAFLVEVDLFRDVPSDALAELASRVEEVAHAEGEVLVDGDATEARLLVVLDGTVRVLRDGQAIRDLGRGDAVGLLAVLGVAQEERVVAVGPCRTLAIPPEEYLDALADHPAFALSNLRALGRRLQRAETDLSARRPPAPAAAADGTR